MSNVSAIAPEHRALAAPAELRRLPAWLIWRYEDNPAPGEPPLKVPYYTSGGRRAGRQGSASDRAKLTTFAAARDAAARRGFDGVGMALLPDWGLTALDFDKCVDEHGRLPAEIEALAATTYTEYSPSGLGVRSIVRGNLGNHKSRAAPDRYGFETFNTNGFVTFTGNTLAAVDLLGLTDTIADAPQDVVDLCDRRFGSSTGHTVDHDDPFAGHEPKVGLSIEEMENLLDVLDADMGREDWIKVGMALHHECEGGDDGFALWDEWSARGSKYPSEDALRQQWDSFTRRQGQNRRQVTMATVIKMARDGNLSVDDLRAVVEANKASPRAPASPEDFGGKYRVVGAAELMQRPPVDWLIKGVIPEADLTMIYGASGSGKSFVAIDLAAAVARGVDWRGHRVKQGRVVIIAAEGGGAFGKRLAAYCKFHGINPETLDIGVITAAPDFMQREEINEVAAALASVGDVAMVIVDTFAQVTPGANENGGEDMGKALGHCRTLREATGAVIVLIHHAGKDAARGARGWSGIRAACDAELEVVRHESGARELRTTKMKDGDDALSWGFRLDVLAVGRDADGDDITSCVAVEASLPQAVPDDKPSKGVKRYGRIQTHVLDMVALVDPSRTNMAIYELADLCVKGMPPVEEGQRDTRMQKVVRAIRELSKGADAPFIINDNIVTFCI